MTMEEATFYVVGSSVGLFFGLLICNMLLGEGWAYHVASLIVIVLALKGCVTPFLHPVH